MIADTLTKKMTNPIKLLANEANPAKLLVTMQNLWVFCRLLEGNNIGNIYLVLNENVLADVPAKKKVNYVKLLVFIRQGLEEDKIGIAGWMPKEYMVADALTRKMMNPVKLLASMQN